MPSLSASTPRGFNPRRVPLPIFPRIGHVYADLLKTRGTEVGRTAVGSARTEVGRTAVGSALSEAQLSESYKEMKRDVFTPVLESDSVCTVPAIDLHLYLAHNLTVST